MNGNRTDADAASPREQCMGVIVVGYRKLNKGSAIGGLATNTEVVNEDKPWLPEEIELCKAFLPKFLDGSFAWLGHTVSSMLPPQIAKSLRLTGKAEAQKHSCTILFTDIVGFTKLSGSSSQKQCLTCSIILYTL